MGTLSHLMVISKTSKVKDWPTPIKFQEIQQHLSLASYYKHFTKNFAEFARPRYQLMEKKASFKWTDQCKHTVTLFKTHLMSAPTLAMPDWSLQFTLDIHA